MAGGQHGSWLWEIWPRTINFRIADNSEVDGDIGYYLGLNWSLGPSLQGWQPYLHCRRILREKSESIKGDARNM